MPLRDQSQAGPNAKIKVVRVSWKQVVSASFPKGSVEWLSGDLAPVITDYNGVNQTELPYHSAGYHGLVQSIAYTADAIWGRCGIQFRDDGARRPALSLDPPNNPIVTVPDDNTWACINRGISFCNDPQSTPEAFMALPAVAAVRKPSAINLFLLPRSIGPTDQCDLDYGANGLTQPRDNDQLGHLTTGTPADIFIDNNEGCVSQRAGAMTGVNASESALYQMVSRTVAHELGHVMLGLVHPACNGFNDIFPDNLMTSPDKCPQIEPLGGRVLAGDQCQRARQFLDDHPEFLIAGGE